jgi:hypothetical protein
LRDVDISHVSEIGLKQIVYAFGKRPSTEKFSNRRFVQRVDDPEFPTTFLPFSRAIRCDKPERERRRTNRTHSIRNTPIHQFSHSMSAYL